MTIIFECSLSAVPHLFDSNRVDQWKSREIPGGGTIQLGTPFVNGDFSVVRIYASLVPIVVTFSASVAASVVGAWIYNRVTSGHRGIRTVIGVREFVWGRLPNQLRR
jgi:hypothetical protein